MFVSVSVYVVFTMLLHLPSYEAARIADALRRELVRQRESLIFETVFSDPAGEKLAFLVRAAATGYNVIFCFIGISGSETSEERMAITRSIGLHSQAVTVNGVSLDPSIQRFDRSEVVSLVRVANEIGDHE